MAKTLLIECQTTPGECCIPVSVLQLYFMFVNGSVSGDIAFDDIIYLSVPRTKSVIFEQRSLAVTGPQLGNSLPIDIKMENSLVGFKRKIKTYLFKQVFNV